MNSKILLLLIFSSIVIMVITGCANRPEGKMLIGKYCFNRESSRDSLFVNSDNTYRHTYSSSDGPVFEGTGKWKYDSVNQEILFEDFVFFNNSGSDGLPPGNWYSRIQMTKSGEVRLMYSSESDIYYFKSNK